MSKLLQVGVRDHVEAELISLAEQQGSTKTQLVRQFIYEGLRARGRDPVGQEAEASQLLQAAS
jgi:hypothetical protein